MDMNVTIIGKRNESSAARLSPRAVGTAQVLLSTFCFGAIGTFAKLAYASGLDSPTLLALRFAVAAAVLWLYFTVSNRGVIRIGRKELAMCAALGLAGYGIFSSLVFKAYESTPASVAGLLFFIYPVFVILIDWMVSRERPETSLWAGALVILAGIAVGVFGTLGGHLTVGLLLAVAGGAWYAAYVVTTRRLLNNLNPQTVALYVTTFAAVGFFLMGGPVLSHIGRVTGRGWLVVAAIAVISTVGALLSFFSGLDKLGSSEASQIGTFELIVTLALATLVLGEAITLPLVTGAAFVLAGMLMGQLKLSPRGRECPDDLPCR
ncbi:MAG TPA: DMT family transporter [Blastocatellia bacterium]|nr:DMT family transporter [Blastocatellia bacterium]